MGTTRLRDFSKHTMDIAGLDEGSYEEHTSQGAKTGAEGAGECANSYRCRQL